jgi:3-hydroxyacyl-CoA dehydrogenase/enoyl-CoA hydratase/3-hydroxybutyryl-CoA epimerase/3-hydroxyacyl-CoA dehydrogenase/enoyl-CoA hydratase/3-hydroxybutyryl-CoA epimerase/enoyl-CoA isomerase
MAEPTITLSMPEPDIAVLTFDAPGKGANVFSRHVLEELDQHLSQLEKRSDLAGLILRSGKPGQFIAGADITEFAAAKDITKEAVYEMCTGGRKLFQRLSKVPFVTVAAIDGIAMGGGAEISCWCDRRIMTDDRRSQIGFPEVKIGIIPGWGGTARAPRMIGLANAVELVCGGESIDGRAARSMGLADDVVANDKIEQAAIGLIRAEQKTKQYLKDRQTWSGPLPLDDTELGFLAVTANAFISGQTKGNYPAPIAALNTMVGAARADIEGACEAEAKGMAELFGTPVNRALINVFLLMDRNKKDTGVDRTDVTPREIKSLGVFGAGIMGAGIAAAAVRKKIPVTINDTVPAALERGVRGILEEVSFDKKLKGPSGPKMLENAPLVHSTMLDVEFKDCDLVIEAVIENPEIKKQLYARIEPQLGPQAILASNTSTIPIGRLAEGLKNPDRFCGIHFFNPVRQMPLVEVIRGAKTSDETVATAVAFAKRIGKSPIVVNDGPGFLVNRLLLPYMNEALELMLDGCDMQAIEKAAQRFGMPMGPFTLYDVVGLDTAFYAGHVMYEAFPDRVVNSPLLAAMVENKRLGQKTGVGFYKYAGGKKGKGEADPTLEGIVAPLRRAQGVKFSTEQIQHRLFLPMVLEATRILEEKVVRDPRDVDLGLIFGTGFPPFKGGLLFWADQMGAKNILEALKPLESLGERAKPTAMLLDLAAKGRGFYG